MNGELFNSIAEPRLLHDRYRAEYNQRRSRSSPGYLSQQQLIRLATPDQRRVLAKSAKTKGWHAAEFFGTTAAGEFALVG